MRTLRVLAASLLFAAGLVTTALAWTPLFNGQALADAIAAAPEEIRARLAPYADRLPAIMADRESLGIEQAGGVVPRLEREIERAGGLLDGKNPYKTAKVLVRIARLAVETTDRCPDAAQFHRETERRLRQALQRGWGFAIELTAYPEVEGFDWSAPAIRCAPDEGPAFYSEAVKRILIGWRAALKAAGKDFPTLAQAIDIRPEPSEEEAQEGHVEYGFAKYAPGPRKGVEISTVGSIDETEASAAEAGETAGGEAEAGGEDTAGGEPQGGEASEEPVKRVVAGESGDKGDESAGAEGDGDEGERPVKRIVAGEKDEGKGEKGKEGEAKPKTPVPGKTDDQGRPASYWREQKKQRQAAVEEARKALEKAEEDLYEARRLDNDDDYGTAGYKEGGSYSVAKARNMYEEAKKRVDEAKAKLREAEDKLSNLASECRAAGCMPGWIR